MDKNLEKFTRRVNKLAKRGKDRKIARKLARQRKAIRQGNY